MGKFYNVTWNLEHDGLEGNGAANVAAGSLAYHAADGTTMCPYTAPTYSGALRIARKLRVQFSHLHKYLTASEVQILREIKANTYIHKSRRSKKLRQQY